MSILRGAFRIVASATIIITTTLCVVLLAWLPVEIRGVRLSAWCFSWGVRLLMPALGLRFQCPDKQAILQHRGFIFSNHVSFFDTIVMAYLLPARFISKAEVKKWPFIGWIAAATGTQFVDREDKEHRSAVRQTVADSIRARQYPPIVVFPEGTRNPLDTLLPFRYGVFEIASEIEMPYLLCAIHYEQTEAMTWHSRKESLMTTVTRIVLRPTSRVWLIPLKVVTPHRDDNPQDLAYEARETVGAALTRIRSGDAAPDLRG
jgi:1-acyl-sn-glycerol-3-phosphate acyltransferase